MSFSESRLDILKTRDGLSLDIHIWEAEKPQAILMAIHGGLAHGGDFITPALFFKEKGITTLAYDLRGHKEESIYITNFDHFLDDTQSFLNWIKENYHGLPIIYFGHSMGSLIGTHFGIRQAKNDKQIKGYVFSSPYYENAIKVNPIVIPVIKILSKLFPKMAVPSPNITALLTHDKDITERHGQDEKAGLRASKATMSFANQLLKSQKWVRLNIEKWNHPLFVVIAGNDKVAQASESHRLLDKINPQLLTYLIHPQNYHENFNEINREETFNKIHEWIIQITHSSPTNS